MLLVLLFPFQCLFDRSGTLIFSLINTFDDKIPDRLDFELENRRKKMIEATEISIDFKVLLVILRLNLFRRIDKKIIG